MFHGFFKMISLTDFIRLEILLSSERIAELFEFFTEEQKEIFFVLQGVRVIDCMHTLMGYQMPV